MQLRDKLIHELSVLTAVLPVYKIASDRLFEQFIYDGERRSLEAFLEAHADLAKKQAVFDFIREVLKNA